MKILRIALVFVLAVFSTLGLAASTEKKYDLQVAQLTGADLFSTVVELKFKNAEPDGNSSFNSLSFSIFSPAGVTIQSVSKGSASGTLNYTPGGTTASITGLSPVKPQETLTLTVVLNGVACGSPTNVTFSALVYTGSSLAGSQFFDRNGGGPGDDNKETKALTSNCDGNLGCKDFTGDPDFDGSNAAGSVGDSGFFAGFRYLDGKSICPLVPYKTTNTIKGSPVTVDGYQLGTNTALISYVQPSSGSVLLAHTITFNPVWSDAQGLFNPARIKYCKKLLSGITDCTPGTTLVPNPNLFVAQGCLSPLPASASIPTGEPGCVSAWYTSIVLPDVNDKCGLKDRPAGGNRTCMLVSIDVTEGADPPWGMTDE